MRRVSPASAIGSYVLMVVAAAAAMTPFVWMVLVSLHPSHGALPDPAHLLPKHLQFANYSQVLHMDATPFLRFLMNTLIVAVSVVCGQLLICAPAAFAFARLSFRGRDWLFYLFVASMMIPGQVTMIPAFLVVRSFGWLNTYWALIVPAISSAFGIFLLRQFFLTLPRELDEAACLDGCSPWATFWRIAAPLSSPALATLSVFAFIATWTDFFWPLLVTSTTGMRTLEVGLSLFKDAFGSTNWPLQMAAAVLVLLPVLLVFLAAQRFFVRGIALTGLKG
ncbi:MAG: carbohydrate ABC transporter permease [Armatimonadetes bacterium]|nr:carbohydrate ABC transporter permease [Armatimonadota bacterium]MDE2206669.1 carbohydrate ABC transporter permease [Armatimonadota bacterium]